MRVSAPKNTFKVILTEYERGWGQRPWDVVYFDNADEAKAYASDYNAKHNTATSVPDWYVVARYAGEVK